MACAATKHALVLPSITIDAKSIRSGTLWLYVAADNYGLSLTPAETPHDSVNTAIGLYSSLLASPVG